MNPEPPREITTVREIHYVRSGPDPGVAVVLEVLPGLLIQTFGIGNIYAGNIAVGILLMLAYWATVVVNFLLLTILIGFVTWPLTWMAFMILSSVLAHSTAKKSAYGA